ncbi:MBL fold metallo-hydrolase [bacterium]|nr:MBL fold metallo-hydrolase [bacterium]
MHLASKLRYFILAGLLFTAVFSWYAVFAESREGVLTVAFLDVGQGDAIFIESPDGNQVLIDGGPNAKVLRGLAREMPFYDRFIDVVVATHPDRDHTAGLTDVFSRFQAGAYFASGAESDNGMNEILDARSKKSDAKKYIARQGTRLDLGDGAVLDILFPDRDASGMETNTSSIVAKLTYGDTSFLFTGDSPIAIEQYLAATYGEQLDVDVLKLGHHGSRTSTSEIFLSAATPEYAIISAGKDNRYGHPHKEVISFLTTRNITTFNTADAGTIVFESDGRDIFLK